MATSYYSTGTVSLTNGSAVVTGNGTGWQLALISGGNVIVQAPGNLLPIASVDSDTQITAELEWTGATGTYAYTIQRDTAYLKSLDRNSESLSYLISEMRNGTLFKYDASGDLAGRALYDLKPKGFGYLVTIGVIEPDFYVKGSDADGDWEGPFAYGVGPVGPQGPAGFLDFRGDYNPATAYVANDGVRYNGSSWVALQSTTGNAPPSLPTTENAYWSLLAIKGQDGAGTGDVVGPASSVDGRIAEFSGTSGKLLRDGGVVLSPFIKTLLDDADAISARGTLGVGWELISIATLSNAASWVVSGLSAFRKLRLTGFVRPATDAVDLFLRTSTDNGVSFDAGASDYRWQRIRATGTTLDGAAISDSGVRLNFNTIGSVSDEGIQFEALVEQFNQSNRAFFMTRSNGVSASGDLVSVEMSAQRQSTTARNAIQLIASAGSISLGHVVIEGIRG